MTSEQRAAILSCYGVSTRKGIKRGSKPFPGMGNYILLDKWNDSWVACAGADTIEAARKKRAKYRCYSTLMIVPNVAPEEVKQPPATLNLEV